MSSLSDVKGLVAAPDAPSDAPHDLSDFKVEHLVEPPKPLTLAQRVMPTLLGFLFNVALFAFLFFGAAYLLPTPPKEKEPVPVDLVQEKNAPPRPKIVQQQPPQEQPKPQPQPDKPFEFKGSGDVTKDKAGHGPVVTSDNTKAKPEKKAEKPKPEAPKVDEANIPDWAKTKTSGYDLPTKKDSSRRADSGRQTERYYDSRSGDGAGDEYSNKISALINSHTEIRQDLLQVITRSTVVSYIIDRRGTLRGVRLVQSSGNREFDLIVIQGVLTSAPFPAFPKGAPDALSLNWVYPEKFPDQ